MKVFFMTTEGHNQTDLITGANSGGSHRWLLQRKGGGAMASRKETR